MITIPNTIKSFYLAWVFCILFLMSVIGTFIFGWWDVGAQLNNRMVGIAFFGAVAAVILRINIVYLATLIFCFFYIALTGIGPLFSVIFFWIAAYILGIKICQYLSKSDLDINPILHSLIGFSAIGLALTILSHFHVNYPQLYLIIFSSIIFYLRSNLKIAIKNINLFLANNRTVKILPLNGMVFILLLIYIYVITVKPDFGHDGLSVHLTIPRFISEYHVWNYDLKEFIWSLLPVGGEMLYTPVYLFGGEDGVRLFNTTCVAATAYLVYALARKKHQSVNTSLLFALAFLSTPLGFYVIGSTFVEPVFTLFVAGMYSLLLIKNTPWGLIFTILGYACTVRISGVVLVPFVFLLFIVKSYKRPNFTKEFIYCFGIFFLFGSINYLYAYYVTGNPVFPLFNHIFQSPFFDLSLNYNQHWIKNSNGLWNIFYAIFDSKNYGDISVNGALGLMPAVLLPILILVNLFDLRNSKLESYLMLVGFLFIYFLFSKQAYLRYIYPAFGIFYLILVCMIDKARIPKGILFIVLLSCIGITLIKIPYAGANFPYDYSILFDEKSRKSYFINEMPYAEVGEILKSFPQVRGKKILLLGEGFDPVYYHYPKNTIAFSWHSNEAYRVILSSQGNLRGVVEKLGVDILVCKIDDGSAGQASEISRLSKMCREITEPFFTLGNVYVGKTKLDSN